MSVKSILLGGAYRNLLRPLLFLNDPENIHDKFLTFGDFLGKYKLTKFLTRSFFYYENEKLKQTVCGLHFKNPVGLSAGFDKDANMVNIMSYVGFGFMQVGTVTLKPYEGNPKPRLYRLPKSRGLVVYYGLKNIGIDKIIPKIKKANKNNFPISISIGKTNNKDTVDTEGGINDYYECFKKAVDRNAVDFYTINISCPNTFGGEPFTTSSLLTKLLSKLTTIKYDKPIFVKMPIDLA